MTDELRQRVQVAIIGAGPSALVLGELLRLNGIDAVLVERHTAEYVRGRVRAGVLEPGTVDLLARAGVADGPRHYGLIMDGVNLWWGDEHVRIDFGLVGKHVVVYGQTRVTADLMAAREASGGQTVYEASDVRVHELESDHPWLTYIQNGEVRRIDCDFVVGCDGSHGITRSMIPAADRREFTHGFEFGWLALLADVPPLGDEVSWVNQPDGFLMCSLRSKSRSRFYMQVPLSARLEEWPDHKFYERYASLLPAPLRSHLTADGTTIEMSITPLESYVCENMRYGPLFLVGDAAHTVPPTGAKGLNLAVADAAQLAQALEQFYVRRDKSGLDEYAPRALSRVWKAVRFSWWMTQLTHRITGSPFERKIQVAELEYTSRSRAAQLAIAENFCGLT